MAWSISYVLSVAFSQDGRRIVSGSEDKTIRVWDAETGKVVLGPLEGHTSLVKSVAFSQDGKLIVSGSKDHSIRVWDAETGKVVSGPLEGLTVEIPQDLHIVSGSEKHTSHISLFSDISTLTDGWICNSSSLLFWVSPRNRSGLCWPRNHFVISQCSPSTSLDLGDFIHASGDSWQQCKALQATVPH